MNTFAISLIAKYLARLAKITSPDGASPDDFFAYRGQANAG